MLISRQLTPVSITSPRQPYFLVAFVRDKEAMWHLPAEVSEAASAPMVGSRLDRKSQEDYKCTVKCNDVRV